MNKNSNFPLNQAAGLTNGHQENLLAAIDAICRIFWGPEPSDCSAMKAGTFFRPFESLKPVMPQEFADRLLKVNVFLDGFEDDDSLYFKLEESYVRLFINAKDGILAPLYQSCYEYQNAPLMGAAAVEMKKRFEASGLTLAETIHEPPDHLCLELEYLYFLLDTRDGRSKISALKEAGSFAAKTMLPWVSELAGRLQKETACRFYPHMALLLVSILEVISEFGGGKLRRRS